MNTKADETRANDIITVDQLREEIVRFRSLCKSRQIALKENTCLHVAITEAERWIAGDKDIGVPDWDMLSQERGIGVADDILVGWQIASSCNLLARNSVTALTEHLAGIVSFPINDGDRQQQFWDECYEIDCAADVVTFGEKVSFIKRKQRTTRTKKRVEFLIRNEWPAECKRPRNLNTIRMNVTKAVEKIAERDRPGLVFLSLQNILQHPSAYDTARDKDEYLLNLKRRFQKDKHEIEQAVLAGLQNSPAVGCVIHCCDLVRYMPSDCLGRPLTRSLLDAGGRWIKENVIGEAILLLENGITR
jgi:hypothetical protein